DPTQNQGRITSSIIFAPSPSGVMSSRSATGWRSSSTGDESFPRRPSPSKSPATRTVSARVRRKYSTDSTGDAAPGRRADDTYESAWRAEVTHDLLALVT